MFLCVVVQWFYTGPRRHSMHGSKKTQHARGWTAADICTNCVCTIPAARDGGPIPYLKNCMLSSSSCHQTVVFHLSTQDCFAVSLNFERSSKVQGRARKMHCSMCAVFSVARPHSHVVSPSKYCHFFRCSLLHV